MLVNNNINFNVFEFFYKVYKEFGEEFDVKMLDNFWYRCVKDVKGL